MTQPMKFLIETVAFGVGTGIGAGIGFSLFAAFLRAWHPVRPHVELYR